MIASVTGPTVKITKPTCNHKTSLWENDMKALSPTRCVSLCLPPACLRAPLRRCQPQPHSNVVPLPSFGAVFPHQRCPAVAVGAATLGLCCRWPGRLCLAATGHQQRTEDLLRFWSPFLTQLHTRAGVDYAGRPPR